MAIPTFFVVHASRARPVGSDGVSEGWVVCRGEFVKNQEVVSTGLYAEWADAQAEAQRLTDQYAAKEQ